MLTRAASAWDRVVSLVGYFDLDPNRALDIILDVFSVNIATHWHFFLGLFSCSPWAGNCSPIRNWEDSAYMTVDPVIDQFRGKSLDDILQLTESGIKQTGSVKDIVGGNLKPKVMAQVMGFKFRHYQVCRP